MKKRSRLATESLGFLLVLGGILIAINVLSVFAHARGDLTEANVFSLAEGSKRVVRELDDQMTVTMYFTEDLPPPFNATERYVRDLLEEYETASEGNLVLKVVHPDSEEEKKAAQRDGAQKVQHRVVENDGVKIREGYRSIVIKYLGDKEVITVGRDTTGLEYEITQAMKKLAGDKRPVGIVKGHGSPSPTKGLSKLKSALPTYELKQVSVSDKISQDLAALLIVDPNKSFKTKELKQIDRYVMNGGSLGVFGGGFKVNLPSRRRPSPITGSPVDTNINRLLSAWGVRVQQGMVADSQCSRAPMRSNMGLQMAVPYPPVPVLSFGEEEKQHPALFEISRARLPFSSPLEISQPDDDAIQVRKLASSSKNSWLMEGNNISLKPKRPREWQPTGTSGPFPLLASVTGKLPSAFADKEAAMSQPESAKKKDGGPLGPKRAKKETRVFVSGSGMFLRDQFLPGRRRGQRQQMTGGLALALNSVDWLAQESDLIAIRAKGVGDPPLEVPEAVGQAKQAAKRAEQQARKALQKGDRQKAQDAVDKREQALERHKEAKQAWERKKSFYRWGNALGIPLAFAVFGVIRWRLRVNKKQKIKL